MKPNPLRPIIQELLEALNEIDANMENHVDKPLPAYVRKVAREAMREAWSSLKREGWGTEWPT